MGGASGCSDVVERTASMYNHYIKQIKQVQGLIGQPPKKWLVTICNSPRTLGLTNQSLFTRKDQK